MRRLLLGPLLHGGLAALGDERAAWFRDDFRHALTSNRFRLARAAAARDALEQAGIDLVLLKGGAFVLRFGAAHAGIRPMSDLDVLVGRGQFHEAARVLASIGYVRAPAAIRLSARAAPAHSFVRTYGAAQVEIDVHRALAQWPLARELTGAIVESAQRVDGWRVPALAPAFCFTAFHRARHGYLWSGLDLLDLKCSADALDDAGWSLVLETAGRCGLEAAAYAAYRQAAWWFGPDEADGRRLAQLRSRLGALSRQLIERMAPLAGPYTAEAVWNRPLVRNLVVMPCATGTPMRALVAAVSFLPLRLADEAFRASPGPDNARGRLRRLLTHIVRGAEPEWARRRATRRGSDGGPDPASLR
jgi:hypothetical protein